MSIILLIAWVTLSSIIIDDSSVPYMRLYVQEFIHRVGTGNNVHVRRQDVVVRIQIC